MEVTPGTRVAERWVVERALARGGQGTIFVAHDEQMGVRVALKVTAAGGAAADELSRRFAREARIGNRLGARHQGFVRSLGWGRLDGVQLYLVMDLVDGGKPLDLRTGTLEQRLERWRRAADLVRVAHEQGVIHRDLKPANFLQAPDGSIYLTDFGLAKVVGDAADEPAEHVSLTVTGVGFGTPPYMPPEQLEDAKHADQRADVYALGCMLFEAAALRLPYPGPTPTAVLKAHLEVRAGKTAPPRPRDVDAKLPEHVDQACVRALELDVAKRCPSVAALFSTLDGQAATRQEPSPQPASVGALSTTPPDALPTGVEGPPAPSSPPVEPALSRLPTGAAVPTDVPRTPDAVATTPHDASAPARAYGAQRGALVAVALLLVGAGALAAVVTSAPLVKPVRLVELAPIDGAVIPALKVDVQGRVDGASAVRIAGHACPIGEDGSFVLRRLALELGPNEVTVEAQPAAPGQETLIRTIRLTADPDDPVLIIATPADGLETIADVVTLRALVQDATAVIVEVDGEVLTHLPLEGGAFTAKVPLPALGSRTLVVVARDAGGRTSRLTRTVTRVERVSGRPLPWSRGPARLPAGVIRGETDGEYVNWRDGSVLVYVPPGTFRMGSDLGSSDERPVHEVRFTRGYFVGKHEVTWAQYREFCTETARPTPSHVIEWAGRFEAQDAHPVFNVSWDDAQAYCRWAGLRLLTEAEWEYAARGPENGTYPWGDEEPGTTRCNLFGSGDGHDRTAPVGSFRDGASPFGALDMAGNVWEWVQDWYLDTYPAGAQTDPAGPASGISRAYRGGSWYNPPRDCRAALRRRYSRDVRNNNLGFRVGRSAED